MSIFSKKEEEIEEDFTKEERKITKNLKDLKPENKKKRKEPPKPWGKKERIFVFFILVATTVISAILLYSNSFHNAREFKFKFPNIELNSLNIFKGETITINKK